MTDLIDDIRKLQQKYAKLKEDSDEHFTQAQHDMREYYHIESALRKISTKIQLAKDKLVKSLV